MKDYSGTIKYKDKEYRLVFNLNVMEKIQDEYKTIDAWGELTDGKNGEPNAKAIIYGFTQMLNEGIEISNEENGTNDPLFTTKQVGRIITEVGLDTATQAVNKTVINSVENNEKNA